MPVAVTGAAPAPAPVPRPPDPAAALPAADIYDKAAAELERQGFDCECLGGGRISHQQEEKKIHVYGYSVVSGPARRRQAPEVPGFEASPSLSPAGASLARVRRRRGAFRGCGSSFLMAAAETAQMAALVLLHEMRQHLKGGALSRGAETTDECVLSWGCLQEPRFLPCSSALGPPWPDSAQLPPQIWFHFLSGSRGAQGRGRAPVYLENGVSDGSSGSASTYHPGWLWCGEVAQRLGGRRAAYQPAPG